LHPDKTRLIEFGRFAAQNRAQRGQGKPESFDFLGFTHICGQSRKTKRFHVWRKSVSKRLRAKLLVVKQVLFRQRRLPIPEQGAWLHGVVQGYFQYHAVPGNIAALEAFRTQALRHWRHALRRRSQRSRCPWVRLGRLADRWLPKPKILHP
jgi:hypothetical protein